MSFVKAFLQTERGAEIKCLFNPETLTMGHSTRWDSKPVAGTNVTRADFKGVSGGTMSMELMLDTTDTGAAVTKYTDQLRGLMNIEKDLPGHDEKTRNARPQWVRFHWGTMVTFEAVVVSLNLTFTYFSQTGVPLRAKAALSLLQYDDASNKPKQNPTSGTPRPSRAHRVQPGETLDRISARYYGDSTRWRMLATANGLEDPLALKPGALLDIPRLEG